MSKTVKVDVYMEIKLGGDASVEEKERALLFVKCERERNGHYRYYLDAGDTPLGLHVNLRYVYAEVCESCGAEITKGNPWRSCYLCDSSICDNCAKRGGGAAVVGVVYVCPFHARAGA